MKDGMGKKSILFVSWQGGLGHITRDVAIVEELRRQNPEINVSWMAHPLACKVLVDAGEAILPESQLSADYNQAAAHYMDRFSLNLIDYVAAIRKPWAHNVDLFRQVMATYRFDLVIGDESYELVRAIDEKNVTLECGMVMIEDFIGLDAMSRNPIDKLGIYLRNRGMCMRTIRLGSRVMRLFIGELEDVPDRRYGFGLPNRRDFAAKHYHFLGYVIRFDPAEYADKTRIRAELGYGPEPLLICATGGTFAGKELLEMCGKAYPLLRMDIPNLRMVCVCGEMAGQDPPALPPGVELHTLIPNLYRHYAACDMAVVVGGGTTTVELTALRRPFIFFPLENQCDQQLYVAERLARQGAGIKMRYYETTPDALAATIRAHIGKEVSWQPIRNDGAQEAARRINAFMARTHERQDSC